MGQEVEQVRRGAVAVELGEVGEDAAAHTNAGEGCARRAVDLVEVRDAEGRDLLQGELQEARLLRHDGVRREPGMRGDLGGLRQLVGHRLLAGHRDLQHDLGIEGLGQAAAGGERVRCIGIARVAFADEVPRPQRLEQVEPVAEVVALKVGDAEPDLRHVRSGLAAEGDLDRLVAARPGRHGRRAALDGERRHLPQPLARRQGVREGQRQRAVVGLVGRVSPVALVLGLPRVGALKSAGEPDPGRHPMAHGGYVVEGLQRHDQAGKARLLHRAVAVGDGAGLARYALHRMQHDEARPAGPELGLGHELDREDQAALALRHDLGAEVEHAVGRVDAPVVAHAEAAVLFLDLQVGDLRRAGLPARAAHDEGEATQRFHAAVTNPAQLAGLERGRERAGGDGPRFRCLLLGTVERERLAGCRGHVPFPAPVDSGPL